MAAYVPFITFFTNFVLIASFVGMSLGCLATDARKSLVRFTPFFIFICIAIGILTSVLIDNNAMSVQVGKADSPERVFFGTIWGGQDFTKLRIPVEVLISIVFVSILTVFVGLGQVLGRELDRVPNRIVAYSTNIGGSLAGIAVFGTLSFYSLPPVVWFLIAFFGVAVFIWHLSRTVRILTTVFFLFSLVGIVWLDRSQPGQEVIWSSYYHINYDKQDGQITTNDLGHQAMRERWRNPAYSVTYLLTHFSDIPKIKDVLIIGAGSGNDIAHALWHDVESIDAVEIDPWFVRIGKRDHPNQPFHDSRVQVHINDGRAFLENTDKQYDFIAYGLVDSLTIHSSYSSVRLESFLYTKEAFEAVKSRLREGGIFAIYNYYREPWIVIRMHEMLKEVFDHPPIAISLPAKQFIRDDDPSTNSMSLLIAGNTRPIIESFSKYGYFQLDKDTFIKTPDTQPFLDHPNGFLKQNKTNRTREKLLYMVAPSQVQNREPVLTATDNWPFLYLRDRLIPTHNWIGMGLIIFFSFVAYCLLKPKVSKGISRHFFFLGTGFMLIETMNVTRLSVLFGSTWMVNAIVFAGILIMILLSNVFVYYRQTDQLKPFYLLLLATLLLGTVVDTAVFLKLSIISRALAAGVFMFAPIFFAGVIFASSFRRSKNPHFDFGSNIAGVVLGALLENLSLVLGFKWLLVIAMAAYVLSIRFEGLKARPAS